MHYIYNLSNNLNAKKLLFFNNNLVIHKNLNPFIN